jgi:WD repeat-containing protein 24
VPQPRLKALGNKSFKPVAQTVGTHEFDPSHQDLDKFSILAKAYVVDGSDKVTICETNGQAALEADHYQVFQMWCLSRSLFTLPPASPPVSLPPTPPLSPLSLSSRALPYSRSAPAAIPTSSALSPSASLLPLDTPRGLSSDPTLNSHMSYPTSGDSSRPVSSVSPSNSPSPQRVSSATQIISSPQSALSTPSTTSTRSPTNFPRRPSSAAFLANRPRTQTSLQRPSSSTPSLLPNETSISPSLRHVGEGTLDDSDSSSNESDLSSLPSAPALSPTVQALSRTGFSITRPHPSPLSRVAAASHQTWTEDEREVDDDSPSPASSDTESDEAAPTRTRTRSQSLRRRAARRRSCSATRARPPVAVSTTQLPLAGAVSPLVLARPGSRSSTRTVTAHDDGEHEPFLPPAQTASSSRVASAGKSISDGLFGPSADPHGYGLGREHGDSLGVQDVYVRSTVRRRLEDVREAIRAALREALEERAEAGDVQTCAMVALVASEELRIGTRRVQLFVEAYVGA